MNFCTNCGAHIAQGTNFCPSCGMAQSAGGQNTRGGQTPPPGQGPGQGPQGMNQPQGPPPGYGPYNYRQEKQWFSLENDIHDNTAVAVLSYPFSIIMLFVILFTDLKNSRYAKFHLNQGLLLVIFSAGFAIIFSLLIALVSALFFSLSGIGGLWAAGGIIGAAGILIGLIWTAYGILSFALLIMGMVHAGTGKMKRLPVIGKFVLVR